MSKNQDTTVNFITEDGEVAVFKVIEETKIGGVKYLLVLECTEKFLYHVLQFSGKHVLEKEF